MSTSGSAVQKQWDIGQSIFLAGAAVIALLSAASQDDVQPQALLALEALGAGLLVHQNRIGEGVDALNGGENRKLSRLKLMVGLNNGGTAREMRKSVSCVAAFVLAVACKTCFTDEETGSLLYEMMNLRGILRKVPVSRTQIEQFIGAISGYGHHILPSNLFNQIVGDIREKLTHPSDVLGLFCRSNILELAQILSNVFEALQDTNVTRITLEGHQTGVWLSSVFIWLIPTDVEILLHGHVIHGAASSRVKVMLNKRDDGSWFIQKWYPEKRVMDLIIGGIDKVPTTQHRALPLSHQPIGSSKTFLAVAYQLGDDAVAVTGQLAAALVDIAFEYGRLGAHNAHGHSEVAFEEICQDHFINTYHTILKQFGWNEDPKGNKVDRSKIVAAYNNWRAGLEEDNIPATGGEGWHSRTLQNMRQLLIDVETQFFEKYGYPMIPENNLEHMGIIDPVIHVTAEALYGSIFDKLPAHRSFRPLTAVSLNANADMLWQILTGKSSSSYNTFHQFRAEAMKSILPGSPQVNTSDLAIVSNGLVAYSAPLNQRSTLKRQSSAISLLPGYLRWGDDHSPFHSLREQDAAAFPAHRSFYENTQKLEVFRDGTYTGLEAVCNSEAVKVETLISPSGKTLLLTTYITSPSLQDAPVAVNWWRSIDALTFSEHINGHDMTVFGEESLARSLEEQKLLETIVWLGVGGNAGGSAITRFISTTSANEDERFFEAGRMYTQRKVLIRQSAPLVQCIKVATNLWDHWAIIT